MTAYQATHPSHDIAAPLAGILAGPDLTGAACARRNRTGNLIHDPDLWFPHQHSGNKRINRANALPAVQICRWCPVVLACRDWAMQQGSIDGIWGGLTEGQRGVLRKKGAA